MLTNISYVEKIPSPSVEGNSFYFSDGIQRIPDKIIFNLEYVVSNINDLDYEYHSTKKDIVSNVNKDGNFAYYSDENSMTTCDISFDSQDEKTTISARVDKAGVDYFLYDKKVNITKMYFGDSEFDTDIKINAV